MDKENDIPQYDKLGMENINTTSQIGQRNHPNLTLRKNKEVIKSTNKSQKALPLNVTSSVSISLPAWDDETVLGGTQNQIQTQNNGPEIPLSIATNTNTIINNTQNTIQPPLFPRNNRCALFPKVRPPSSRRDTLARKINNSPAALRTVLGPARKVLNANDIVPPEDISIDNVQKILKRQRIEEYFSISSSSDDINDQNRPDNSISNSSISEQMQQTTPSNGYITTKNGERIFFVRQKKYQEQERLGSGGSSQVYKVMDDKKQIYAQKRIVLNRSQKSTQTTELKNNNNEASPPTTCIGGHIAEYRNEIAQLQKMHGKPNIIQLITYEEINENIVHILLEAGNVDLNTIFKQSLQQHRKSEQISSISTDHPDISQSVKGSGQNETQIRFYWQEMLRCVHIVHSYNVIHLDQKPANFVQVNGQQKIIDFGIAKSVQTNATSVLRDSLVGTLNYMSPESIIAYTLIQDQQQQQQEDEEEKEEGNENDKGNEKKLLKNTDTMKSSKTSPTYKVGRSADVWSLGCILYQMVYGTPPFAQYDLVSKIYHITNTETNVVPLPPLPTSCTSTGFSYVLDVLQHCLVRDPKKRYTIDMLLSHPFLVQSSPYGMLQVEHILHALTRVIRHSQHKSYSNHTLITLPQRDRVHLALDLLRSLYHIRGRSRTSVSNSQQNTPHNVDDAPQS